MMRAPPRIKALLVDVVWTSGQRAVSVLLYLAVTAVLARLVVPEVFGKYFLTVASASALGLLAGTGMNQISLRRVATAWNAGSSDDAAVDTFGSLLWVCCATLAFCGLFLAVVTIPRGDTAAEAVGLGSPLASCLLLLGVTMQTQVSSLLRATRQFRLSEFVIGPGAYVPLLGYVLIMLAIDRTPGHAELVLVTAGLYLVPSLLGICALLRCFGGVSVPIALRSRIRRFHPSFREAGSVSLHGVALFAVRQGALWVGALTLGGVALGLLAAGIRVSSLLSFPLSAVTSVVAPTVASDHGHEDSDLQDRIAFVGVLAAAPSIAVATVMLLAPGWILAVLFGESYRAGAVAFSFLVLGHLANAIAGPCGVVLLMTGNHKLLTLISCVGALSTLSVGYLMARATGLTGLAGVFGLGFIAQNVAMWWAAHKCSSLWTHFQPARACRVARAGVVKREVT